MVSSLSGMKRQQGMTAIGWMIIMAMVGFFLMVGFQLFPIYSNNMKMTSILESLTEEKNIYRMSRRELIKLIQKRAGINLVSGFKPDHLVIELKNGGTKEIRFRYEDRKNLFGNLDVVAVFDDYIIVSPGGEAQIGL